METKKEKKMKLRIRSYHKKGTSISTIRRIVYLALAALSLTFLAACKKDNKNEVILPSTTIEIPTEEPSATPVETIVEVTPTVAPVEFSYEKQFKKVFSDEALSQFYPNIQDFETERTRIFNNISRIEDFEYYGLTEEEQVFIKAAQLGNIQESDQLKLTEILIKILQNDPYVFDDVDNEVKIDNRVDKMMKFYEILGFDISDQYNVYEPLEKEALIVCNCGNLEGIDTDISNILYNIDAGLNINQSYYYKYVLPDFNKNNWQGNYGVFDFSKYLLDGSEGQKIAKKLYEANVKIFSSNKEDLGNNLKETVDVCLNILFLNDALGNPGGINSVDSKVHKTIIYTYSLYMLFSIVHTMEPSNTYSVSDECIESLGLLNPEISVYEIKTLVEKYIGNEDFIYSEAFKELEEAQIKYGNENIVIRSLTDK